MAAGPGSSVSVTVKSSLLKIVEDLNAISAAQQGVRDGLKTTGNEVGKSIDNDTKKVRGSFERMRQYGKSVSKGIRDDFKSLFALNAVGGAMKLSEQFKGTIKQTVSLSDAIRRLGTTLGVPQASFAKFQERLTKGLGEIGLSSDVASRSLEALSETPVRGQENLLEYSKLAGQLAVISGTQGQEGAIAKGIAEVLRARGIDPNNMEAAAEVGEDMRRVQNATGRKPGETLSAMTSLYSGMDQEMRGKISSRGLANLAATSSVAGPNSTKFLEEFLQSGSIGRMRFEAQGFKDVFTDQGLDVDKFREAGAGIMGRIQQDPRMAAQTLGISEEAAEGFVRLYESLDQVKKAQDDVARSTGNIREQYRSSMGMGDAFRASINRLKGAVSGPLSEATQGLTSVLGKMSESDTGAALVTGGAGLAAALLAGKGLKGLGGGMLGGMAKGAAYESVTGEKVIPVNVVNWPTSMQGSWSNWGGAAKKAGGAVAGAAAGISSVGVAATVGSGLAAGKLAEYIGTGEMEMDIKRAFKKMFASEQAAPSGPIPVPATSSRTTIQVELKSKDVRQIPGPRRGGSH